MCPGAEASLSWGKGWDGWGGPLEKRADVNPKTYTRNKCKN